MKRLLLLAGLVIGAGFAQYASAAVFSDVEGTRYEEAFTYLSDRFAVQGFPNGSGQPHALLNRAQALKVFMTIMPEYRSSVSSMNGRAPTLPLFRDIDQRAWYAMYVEVAFRQGLVTGYPDRTFKPGQSLTTEEAIAMLLRAYKETGGDMYVKSSAALPNLADQWFTPYINGAIEKNLVSSNERLALGKPITRGQFFDMVYRMDTVRQQKIAYYNRPEPVTARPVQPGPRPATAISQPAQRPSYISNKRFAITIPSLGIKDLTIGHPSDISSNGLLAPLKYGVGHLLGYPGGDGKILIYGHSSSYSWDVSEYTKIFRTINTLKSGEKIYVTYNDKMYVYQLSYSETVPASDTSRYKGKGEELILYTCWPPDKIAHRFLWHATPVETIALQ